MGKSDQSNVQNDINRERQRQLDTMNSGANDTQNRINQTRPQSDAERQAILEGYRNQLNNNGISQEDRDRLLGVVNQQYTGSINPGRGGPSTPPPPENRPNAPTTEQGIANRYPTDTLTSNNRGITSGDVGSRLSDNNTNMTGGPTSQGPGSNPVRRVYDYSKPDYLQPDNSYLNPNDAGYRGTFQDLTGKNGGFDETRLANINTASGRLRDTSGNYGDVNKSIGALQNARQNYGQAEAAVGGLKNIADTRGMAKGDFENINRGTLQEMERTGGYSEEDKNNLRARSNAGIASTYANLRSGLDRSSRIAGQLGPGWSEAGFKLARQGAQDTGVNARNTEADIADRVAANRMAASGKLGDLNLGLHGQQVDAGIRGYTGAGSLDIDKNTSINNAMTSAGQLGLTRQKQIDEATAASGDLDVKAQDAINRARLGGATGLSNDDIGKMDVRSRDALERAGLISRDTLGRMQITSNEGIAAAGRASQEGMFRMGLDATNQRFLINEGDSNRNSALGGMTNLYGTNSGEQGHNDQLLYNYRTGTNTGQQGLINSEIGNNSNNQTDYRGWLGTGLAGGSLLTHGFSSMPFGAGPGGQGNEEGFMYGYPGTGGDPTSPWNPGSGNGQPGGSGPHQPYGMPGVNTTQVTGRYNPYLYG